MRPSSRLGVSSGNTLLTGCAQILSGKLEDPDEEEVWLRECNASFAAMIRDKQSREAQEAKATVYFFPHLISHFVAWNTHVLQFQARCKG